MKHLLILGGGTAGTMVANKLRRRLDDHEWRVIVVDQDDEHHYQPGYLFIPFGDYRPDDVVRRRRRLLAGGIEFLVGEVDRVDAQANRVHLQDGRQIRYDYLVIASGTTPRPDQTPGMLGPQWRTSIFDFYTLEGAQALGEDLRRFDHGQLVVHITEMPIKCPVAQLEFAFLAEAWLRKRGLRDRVELSSSPRSTAPSPGRSPPSAWARCSPSGRSTWSPTSWSSASTTTAASWSPTTSARFPTTCWSRCP